VVARGDTSNSVPSVSPHRPPPKPPPTPSPTTATIITPTVEDDLPSSLDTGFDPKSVPIKSITKLDYDQWVIYLDKWYRADHPEECNRILYAIRNGIDIEYTGKRNINRRAENHIKESELTKEQLEQINGKIQKDVMDGKKLGPFDKPPYPYFSVSPLGMVVKPGQTKIRIVHDLSHPDRAMIDGDSINGNIREEDMELGKFDDACNEIVKRRGRTILLLKLDIDGAYKIIPVRYEDWPLLGFKWKEKYYIDVTLPFGLKSSCRLWDLFATALNVILIGELGNSFILHYVDDFLIIDTDNIELVKEKLELIRKITKKLGVPLNETKTCGPTDCLTFLGIEINSTKMEMKLDNDRLNSLRTLLCQWETKIQCTMKELQSLIGILEFATKVIRPGRLFLKRLIDLVKSFNYNNNNNYYGNSKKIGKAIRVITPDAKADIHWWIEFLPQWNGKSLLYDVNWLHQTSTAISLSSDACQIGYGARCGREWIRGEWTEDVWLMAKRKIRESMPFLELYALVLAAFTWGSNWRGKRVIFQCDCEPIVNIFKTTRTHTPGIASLLRRMAKIAAINEFDYKVNHIEGVKNRAADLLSRNDMTVFFNEFPSSQVNPQMKIHKLLLPFTMGEMW
jgi:hypothetical protein